MSKEDQVRGRVVSEIISTEVTYVGLLEELASEVSQIKIKLTGDPGPKAVRRVADDATSIHKLQVEFLKDLKNLEAEFIQKQGLFQEGSVVLGTDELVVAVAKIFTHYAKFFKLYTTYIDNFCVAQNFLNESFGGLQVLRRQTSSDKIHLPELFAKLILPIQRIPRYVLLLDELVKHSKSIRELEEASKMIHGVASDVDRAMNKREYNHQLRELQRLHIGDIKLLEPHRKLVKSQDYNFRLNSARESTSNSSAKLTLFNDMALVSVSCPMLRAYAGVCIFAARNLLPMDSNGFSDPYAKIYVLRDGREWLLGKTPCIQKTLDPEWRSAKTAPTPHSTYFEFLVSGYAKDFPKVFIEFYDKDVYKNDFLGSVSFDLSTLINLKNDNPKKVYKVQSLQWHKLQNKRRRQSHVRDVDGKNRGDAKIKLEMVYVNDEEGAQTPDKLAYMARKILGYASIGGRVQCDVDVSHRTNQCYREICRVGLDAKFEVTVRNDTRNKGAAEMEIQAKTLGTYWFDMPTREDAEEWVKMIKGARQIYLENCLVSAVQKKDGKRVQKYLKEHRVSPDVEALNPSKAPLMMAVSDGSVSIAKLLLKYKAHVNKPGRDGETVLMRAAQIASRDLIKLLMKYKADPSIEDKGGKRAVHHSEVCMRKYLPSEKLKNPVEARENKFEQAAKYLTPEASSRE